MVVQPFQDDLTLCPGKKVGALSVVPPASPSPSIQTTRGEHGVTSSSIDTQSYTESALRELFQQVNNMPESAKKKKLIRQVTWVCIPVVKQTDKLLTTQLIYVLFVGVQFEKQPLLTPTSDSRTPFSRKHWRSRSLGGIIKVNLCAVRATSPFITNNIITNYAADFQASLCSPYSLFCILPCGLCCFRGYVAFILYECEVCGTESSNLFYRI